MRAFPTSFVVATSCLLALARCGEDGAAGGDAAGDTPSDADADEVAGGDAETAGDAGDGDAAASEVDDADVTFTFDLPEADGSPSDPECVADPRVSNGWSIEKRCDVCRDVVGGARVRGQLLWSGSYDEPALAEEPCEDFPDEPCRASRVTAEVIWCENMLSGLVRVVWSDIASVRVGEGAAQRDLEVRGLANGMMTGEVWRAAEEFRVTPAGAFQGGDWRVIPEGGEGALTARISAGDERDACPVVRFSLDRAPGRIAPCEVAADLVDATP